MRRGLPGMLVAAGLACLALFASYEEYAGAGTTGARVGRPTPWLEREWDPEGARTSVNPATSSAALGVLGVAFLAGGWWAFRRRHRP